jgi:prepilin-type processing-associated H-X9-DG protein
MPFTEEDTGYKSASDGDAVGMSQRQLDLTRELIKRPLPLLGCPSRRGGARPFPKPIDVNYYARNASENPSGEATAGRGDYAINCGDQPANESGSGPGGGVMTSVPDPAGGRGSSVNWCLSSVGKNLRTDNCHFGTNEPATGVSFQRSEVAISHVTDGTSKTYLIGEKFIMPMHYETGRDPGDNETWCTGYNNDNYRTSYLPPARDIDIDQFRAPYRTDTSLRPHQLMFGSVHSAGLNMSYCDGHVDTLTYDIDPYLHRSMGNRHEGSVDGENWRNPVRGQP